MAKMIDMPSVTCGNGLHHEVPSADPVFHFVEPDGHHGVAGLETAKAWARSVWEDGVPFHEFISDLYILLPGSRELIRVTLNVACPDGNPEMEIEALKATVLDSGVVYTCKI